MWILLPDVNFLRTKISRPAKFRGIFLALLFRARRVLCEIVLKKLTFISVLLQCFEFRCLLRVSTCKYIIGHSFCHAISIALGYGPKLGSLLCSSFLSQDFFLLFFFVEFSFYSLYSDYRVYRFYIVTFNSSHAKHRYVFHNRVNCTDAPNCIHPDHLELFHSANVHTEKHKNPRLN